jgi:hypothetical protein
MVICLGIRTFNAIRAALNLRPLKLEAIDYTGPAVTYCGSEVLACRTLVLAVSAPLEAMAAADNWDVLASLSRKI